jgi:hypothetical protein
MKKLLMSAAIIVLAVGVNAQKGSDDVKKVKFSAGLEAALPLGDFGKAYSFGIGATAQVDYNVAENLDLTGNVGYISFSGKTISTPAVTVGGTVIFPATNVKVPSVGYIPVLVGAKYLFSENIYGSAQLGVTIASAKGSSSSVFTYAPGIGYKISDNLDALLKYTGYSQNGGSSSTIGVRVAYTF